MMKMNLPSDVTVKGVTYGTPRVGNDKFAAFFDSKVCGIEPLNFCIVASAPCPSSLTGQFQVDGAFQRVNNEKDIVPIGFISTSW
jgi:hypothetical protein